MATNNLSGLATDLMKVYDELRAGTIEANKAKDLAKIANAAVNTARVVFDFNKWSNPKGTVPTSTDIPLLK